jgi:hypothetical protein
MYNIKKEAYKTYIINQSIFFLRAVCGIQNKLCGLKTDFLVNLVLYIVTTKFLKA